VKRLLLVAVIAGLGCTVLSGQAPRWGTPQASVVPEADGYVNIPNAAVQPDPRRTYKAIYDATKAAKEPSQLLPALNMAGSELNAFAAAGVPASKVKFVIVFHGGGLTGILDDAHYREKFGVANPNLKALAEMRRAGVQLFVCGQNLIAENIDPSTISRDVTVASDALIVLMAYQNDGYALMSF
jgi:intracellular sulfur oxidation DsrE/DsrF family protein